MAIFQIKPEIAPSTLGWVISGTITFVGALVATITKIMTRNHLSRKEAYKTLQTTKMCDERSGNIEQKLDNRLDDLKEHINIRFDDLKDLILKNEKK